MPFVTLGRGLVDRDILDGLEMRFRLAEEFWQTLSLRTGGVNVNQTLHANSAGVLST